MLILERMPTLACMHGSAWHGDGAALLGALAQTLNTHGLARPAGDRGGSLGVS